MAGQIELSTIPLRDGRSMPVHMARPDGQQSGPGLVMLYELWGMQETPWGGAHMKDVAIRLANAGYVAIIPDYYEARNKFPRFEDGKIVGGPSDDESIEDLISAVRWLQNLDFVDDRRIGVVGWCGGGRQALYLAAECPEISAAASFYGRPVNRPHMLGPSPIDMVPEINCAVFGAYGENDKAIPVETVRSLQSALQQSGKTHEIHIYEGAGHAFMNDAREDYDESAARDSWQRLLAFFDRYVQKSNSK